MSWLAPSVGANVVRIPSSTPAMPTVAMAIPVASAYRRRWSMMPTISAASASSEAARKARPSWVRSSTT